MTLIQTTISIAGNGTIGGEVVLIDGSSLAVGAVGIVKIEGLYRLAEDPVPPILHASYKLFF